jgi:hypothetical protein
VAYSIRSSEKRRDIRQPIAGKLRVLWEDSEGKPQICIAELVDISSKGLKIRVDLQMPPRTDVSVNDRERGIMGRGCVRYCRFEKGKYSVGLEFSGGTGWSQKKPERSELVTALPR